MPFMFVSFSCKKKESAHTLCKIIAANSVSADVNDLYANEDSESREQRAPVERSDASEFRLSAR